MQSIKLSSIHLSLIMLFISSIAYSQNEIYLNKYSSISECKEYYKSLANKPPQSTEDSYCANKLMTDLEMCAGPKIKHYLTEKKLIFSNLTNSEQNSLKNKYSYECQANAIKSAQSEAQQRAAAQQARSNSGSGSGANGAGAAGLTGAAATLVTAKAALDLAQQGQKITGEIEAKTKAAADRTIEAPAVNTKRDTVAEQSAVEGNQRVAITNEDGSRVTAVQDASGKVVASKYSSSDQVKAEAQAQADAQKAQSSLDGDINAVKNIDPKLANATKDVKDASATNSNPIVKRTEITDFANAVDSELTTVVENSLNAINLSAQSAQLSGTFTALQKFRTSFQSYVQGQKKACVSKAETASFVCAEGTSPGAIATKTLMNSAAPILAIISSAQKSCSATARITKLANTTLTIANGLCVATKMVCNHSCQAAKAEVTKITTELQTFYTASINEAVLQEKVVCAPNPFNPGGGLSPLCLATRKAIVSIPGYVQTADAKLRTENIPTTLGTSASVAAKCDALVKDVLLFGTQMLGTWAAYKNAKQCEEDLGSSANNQNISTQQFCEKSENVSSQICVCQKNNMASGCPGALLAANTTSPNQDNSGPGVKIQSTTGNSAFAGGSKNSIPAGPQNKLQQNTQNDLGKNPNSGEQANTASNSQNGASGTGYTNSSGASSRSGADTGSGSGSDSAAGKNTDSKKWSFGAFGSGGGGLSSFFGSSKNNSKDDGSRSGLDQKDLAAIKRKVASESIAAEVSPASGKSNWDKISHMYKAKETSLFGQ